MTLAADLRKALDDEKARGLATVDIDRLRQYLDAWERSAADAGQALPEIDKHQQQIQLKHLDHHLSALRAGESEMFASVLEAGASALKAATLVNGGAAAAVLAFIGAMLKPEMGTLVLSGLGAAAWAWFTFMAGLGMAAVATGVRYLSQAWYTGDYRHQREHGGKHCWQKHAANASNGLSIALAVSSYASFFWGSWLLVSWILTKAA